MTLASALVDVFRVISDSLPYRAALVFYGAYPITMACVWIVLSVGFARRREGQVRDLAKAAAAVAERVLLPEVPSLDAVVLGGDRAAVDAVLEERALAPLRRLAVERFLTVPDPRRAILEETPAAFRAVRIRVAP